MRVAIVSTSGSGKNDAAKGSVERHRETAARICIIDPRGAWWGLRINADGIAPGYPAVVVGGCHADVSLDESLGAILGRLIGNRDLCRRVVRNQQQRGSRRFMTAFAKTCYEANTEPLHLVLNEADRWAPQRPLLKA